MSVKSYRELASLAYAAFYKRAGGLTYDGKPLALWAEISADQQACWIDAVHAVTDECKHFH